jgi:hypothetical protein
MRAVVQRVSRGWVRILRSEMWAGADPLKWVPYPLQKKRMTTKLCGMPISEWMEVFE